MLIRDEHFVFMANNIDHFIFVPGIGAGKKHPAGRLITQAVERLTKGDITTELAETCDEIDNVIVPHSLERQAESLAERISRYRGRVALFAHSQGGLPTALALNNFDLPQVDVSNVVFAGTPLDSEVARQRTIDQTSDDFELCSRIKNQARLTHTAILGVKCTQSCREKALTRYIVITSEHLDSYPKKDEHLANLAELHTSTLLVSGEETVTDCTPENIRSLLPERIVSNNPDDPRAKTIVIEGADHNLKGFCDTHIPELLASRILGK